jgi:hypothetical protein
MKDKIVTLDSYYDPMLAEITRTRLEANGIACFIADDNMIGANPLFNQAIGGVKLKVFERDVEKCREILAQSEELALDDEAVEEAATICPYCHSTNVRYGVATEIRTDWFTSLLSFIVMAFPFMIPNKAWHCFNCQKDF